MNKRPAKEEYSSHFDDYVQLVPVGDIQSILRQQLATTSDFLANYPEQLAPGILSGKYILDSSG